MFITWESFVSDTWEGGMAGIAWRDLRGGLLGVEVRPKNKQELLIEAFL
jgi:hypothetical protein